MNKKTVMIITAAALIMSGCTQIDNTMLTGVTETVMASTKGKESQSVYSEKGKTVAATELPGIDADELFTERDMDQTPDTSDAEKITVTDGKDTVIDKEGIYILTGNAKDSSVIVDAGSSDKVQLVLDGLTISNSDTPCIYVKSADKVFITTASDENELEVTGSFDTDGDTKTNAVIFSKDGLVLNGTGSLKVSSTDNGISGKDSVKITGGSLKIGSEGNAVKAHDAILIADVDLEITKCNDGLHAEDDDDDTTGQIVIEGGTIDITAADDAIHATTIVKIDDGNITLTGSECIEGTVVQINGGTINIKASDDGINAARKSSAYDPLYEQNGGNITIEMGAGDTDGVDSNGDIRINGGTISISGQSTFDYDKNAEYNGGTIIENGEETNTITNQLFGGPGGTEGPGGISGNNVPGGMGKDMRPGDISGNSIPGGKGKNARPGNISGNNVPGGPRGMGKNMRPGDISGNMVPGGMGGPGGPGGMGGPKFPEDMDDKKGH